MYRGHLPEDGLLRGLGRGLPPAGHPPDQLQGRQHQVLAQALVAVLPLGRVAVYLAEHLPQVVELLRPAEHGAEPALDEAAGRQTRQRQGPDADTQRAVGLPCPGKLVVERAAAAQDHIPGRHLVAPQVHGVVPPPLQDQQHLGDVLVAVHQGGVVPIRPVGVADVGDIGLAAQLLRRLRGRVDEPLLVDARLFHTRPSPPAKKS